jgi:hypothetical protein
VPGSSGRDGGSGFPDDPAAAVATMAAVFPAGWRPVEDDPLTEDELWELADDPGTDLTPGQLDALIAQLPPELRDDPELADGDDPPGVAGMLGLMPRDIAVGGGFDAGGVADQLPPGPVLAALAQRTWQAGLGKLNDDELAGLALAWRRLQSWATAGELTVIAELGRRRTRDAKAAGDPGIADHLDDELAMAMTLTGRSAGALLEFAHGLARLPRTRAALAAGLIDRAKAHLLADELWGLDGPHAAKVERALLVRAPQQTTGQLRAAAKRAVLAIDPAAAKKRQQAARRDARVEVWQEPSGTASLVGRDLPPAEVLAADQRITALARRLKAAGREGTMDQLRAQAYTALLLGHSPADPDPAPAPAGSSAAAPAAADRPSPVAAAGARGTTESGHVRPGASPAGPNLTRLGELRGSVNLTMPLATWLGGSAPGEAAGFGPIPADDARALARLLAARPGNRWCLTLTGESGRALAHGCATSENGRAAHSGATIGENDPAAAHSCATSENGRAGHSGATIGENDPAAHSCATISVGGGGGGAASGGGGSGRGDGEGRSRGATSGAGGTGPPGALTVTITPLATGSCAHERETPGYQPSPGLRHALQVRQRTCSAPGCRRDATGCDLDHTIPYARGGRTCECGLAPLCRRHHRAKQTYGWRLDQPAPGVLRWQLPHGRSYRAEPDPYPE